MQQDSPEIDLHIFSVESTKMPRKFNGEGIVFSTNDTRTIRYYKEKKNLGSYLASYTKITNGS